MKIDEPVTTLSPPPAKWMRVLLHFAVWGVLFGLPFFFTGREPVTIDSYIRFTMMPVSFMVVFYINYFLLIKHYLFTHRTMRFLLSNLIQIVAVMLVVHLTMKVLPETEDTHIDKDKWRAHTWQETAGFYFGNILLYSLVGGVSVAIRMTSSWYEIESTHKELEKSRAEAELQNLKSQLNPHFLFNTLNNIYSLIAFSPERAQGAVHDLSRLLRYVLYESSQPTVAIEQELNFIQNYVELMRIRLPESVDLKLTVSNTAPGTPLAPLLFISPIENAFKHGVSNMHPSFIHITIKVTFTTISCLISNSNYPKDTHDQSGSGIGLLNLHKRLALLYPDNHQFDFRVEGDTYHTNLIINRKEETV